MTYSGIKKLIENYQGRDIALEIFRHSLKRRQRELFDLLPYGVEKAKSSKDIALEMNIEPKKVPVFMHHLNSKFGKIQTIKVNNKTKYFI